MMLDLKKYEELMAKCSHCEFCQATCPVFLEDLLETHVARARLELIRASLVEGSLPVTKRLRDVISRCLLCTNCVQTCPAGVPIDEIVVAARHRLYEEKRLDAPRRYLVNKFMSRRGFSGFIGMAEALAQRMGLTPRELPAQASKRFESLCRGVISPKEKARARVAYYVGCATNAFYPDTAMNVVRVLTRNGIEVVIPDGLVCCGLPALVEGDLATVQKMVRVNIPILASQEVDAIITDCTSCGMMLRTKVAKALPENDPLRLQAELIGTKVWEVTDYLNNVGLSSEPLGLPEKYTYHVPCHRGWTPTINDAPRNLLAAVPQAELVEMEYPERCCGAGGTFYMNFRELSENIRSHKLEDIGRTGVKTVLTQCPACRSYLSAPLADHTVMHPISFLAGAYGFEP